MNGETTGTCSAHTVGVRAVF